MKMEVGGGQGFCWGSWSNETTSARIFSLCLSSGTMCSVWGRGVESFRWSLSAEVGVGGVQVV